MHLSQFQFNLPPELIAQNPAVPRDSARLLVYDRLSGRITHAHVRDLPDFLPAGTTLVANNSKVRKARLLGTANGKPVELLVLEAAGTDYRCLIGGRATKIGRTITLDGAAVTATVLAKEEGPGMTSFIVHFDTDDAESMLEQYGRIPLPPYITKSTARDEQYQTVFADETGSAAAPTAGLHFTPDLLARLRAAGMGWEEVTLHVGLGTFLPLRQEVVEENRLHKERTYISTDVAARLNAAARILAVGTTSTRTLESHSSPDGLVDGELETDMFMYPGYRFQTVGALMTNFHLPHSSLLMLVAAFLGNSPDNSRLILPPEDMPGRLLSIYEEAIKEKYRFFSFGDAMLIL